jgi:tRNA pseudouridine38-40 synthase
MRRLALVLAYDGSRFDGWQTQPSGRAIQDHLELALAAIAGHQVVTVCAGRTDAGVHAFRQVVHFDTDAQRPETAWVRGVNSHLPSGVAVRHVVEVDTDFHARFGAQRRRYRYFLHVSPVRHPLLAGRAGWSRHALDQPAMTRAADLLTGEHDFSAFRSSQCQAASPVRQLEGFTIEREGAVLVFTLTANAFLHHMVRNLVGLLVAVGSGRCRPEFAAELLEHRDRRLAPPTFEAAGLYLEAVQYDVRYALPSWGGSLTDDWLA